MDLIQRDCICNAIQVLHTAMYEYPIDTKNNLRDIS